MQDAGLTPDVFTYSCLIRAYIEGKQWEMTETAFRHMQAAGLTPDVYTYNCRMLAYGKGEQWQSMEEAFKQMGPAGVNSTFNTYTMLFTARAGKWIDSFSSR